MFPKRDSIPPSRGRSPPPRWNRHPSVTKKCRYRRQEARKLPQKLDQYQLKNVSEKGLDSNQVRARRPGKVAVAWTCYHEAQIQAVHVDQDAPPQAFIGAWQAWSTLGKFVVAVGGITALVGGLL